MNDEHNGIAYLKSIFESIVARISEKYIDHQLHSKVVNISQNKMADICYTFFKFNLICYLFVKNGSLGNQDEISNFIYHDNFPESIFSNVMLISELLDDYRTICHKGYYISEFSPFSYSKISYPYAYDWRFYVIGSIKIKNSLANRKLISRFISNENTLFGNDQKKSSRICDYILTPFPSSGEYSYLMLFSRLFMILSSFQDNYGDHNSYIVFIDEGEVGFHPSWKKKYLSWLLDFFNSQFNKYSIQLILTTHSPYLLSDLPPENCILLRKSKLRQPEQVPENELKTFGANIHELLATSFFLQDGLIGDFAKKTIQTVIDFLNTWKKGVEINKGEKEFVKYVISIVSDEIVRFKLLDMYNEIFYDETIIEDEILEMQKRIESLKKMRDDRN
ncbi:MAG: AAA family ATPase [Bacteroidetes bacterium]|nr:AAA family ATPase [Bacteroidota bacterium]